MLSRVIAKNVGDVFFETHCMSVTKDSAFAAMAGERYEVAFQHVQWVFSVDQCISSLFFFITVL